jgi:hypothetical protein
MRRSGSVTNSRTTGEDIGLWLHSITQFWVPSSFVAGRLHDCRSPCLLLASDWDLRPWNVSAELRLLARNVTRGISDYFQILLHE